MLLIYRAASATPHQKLVCDEDGGERDGRAEGHDVKKVELEPARVGEKFLI